MKKIYIKEEACIGCGLCQVHCQIEHSHSKDIIKAFKKEFPQPLPRVRVEILADVSFAIQCRQCGEPWCVYFCPTGAMRRDAASGMVTVDVESCIGCWTCIVACPYGALARDIASKTVVKCDLCPGRDIPVCVVNCPNDALALSIDGEKECLVQT